MKPIKLDYQGLPVLATRDAWFNATDMAAIFGKRVNDWLCLKETRDYIERLNKSSNTSQNGIWIKTKRGNNGGTWLHRKLAVRFAGWCNIDFAIWCDEQIELMLTSGKLWQEQRNDSKAGFRVMCAILQQTLLAQGKQVQPYHYANEARCINRAITGQWRALNRDGLDQATLSAITALEIQNSALIALGKPQKEREHTLHLLSQSMPSLKQLEVQQ